MKKPSRRSWRDPYAIAFSRDQRRHANEFAAIVWQIIRDRGCRKQKFRREYPIPPYTADFCCVALKLIIEVDGEHHQKEEGRERDARRDQYLAERGFAVLRIPGYEVLRDPAAVRCLIENAIDARIAHLGPLTPDPFSPSKLRERGVRRIYARRTLALGESLHRAQETFARMLRLMASSRVRPNLLRLHRTTQICDYLAEMNETGGRKGIGNCSVRTDLGRNRPSFAASVGATEVVGGHC